MRTRITYTIFLKSETTKLPFLGITTEIYKDYKQVYSDSHIVYARDELDLSTLWRQWRDFLQQGKPTKVSSGHCYGRYITAAKEWEA